MTKEVLIFLFLNFLALAVGGWLMGEGPSSEYYITLNKAPWTPPGWVFGAAWFTIMVCFSFYMAYWTNSSDDTSIYLKYGIHWILNVSWNYLFFNQHLELISLIVIAALTLLLIYFLYSNWSTLQYKSLFIAPYVIWLVIATSLNWYIWAYN